MADLKESGPPAIPPPDQYQLERLNALYRIVDEIPPGGGLKSRLASGVRRLLGRVLSRQQEFNAIVVDHINRNMTLGVAAHQASLKTLAWISGAVNRCDPVTDEITRPLAAPL